MKPSKLARLSAAIASMIALAPFGTVARSAAAALAVDYVYEVKPGDTLFSFGRAYLVDANAERVLQKLNHIANPRVLPVGKVLHIPRRLLRDEMTQASIASFAGPVTLADHGHSLPVRAGVKLDEGAEIETGRNAFITLRLSDGTVVSLPSQSKLRLTHMRRPQQQFPCDDADHCFGGAWHPVPRRLFARKRQRGDVCGRRQSGGRAFGGPYAHLGPGGLWHRQYGCG